MKSTQYAGLVVGALAMLLPFGVAGGVVGGEVTEISRPATGIGASSTAAIDGAIDLMIQQRVEGKKLSAADARVAREQLQIQFMSLPAADQQRILAAAQRATSEEGVAAAMKMMGDAVQATARQIIADLAADAAKAQSQPGPQIKQKLGGVTEPDLVFVPTAGPCRVGDTRLWPVRWLARTGACIRSAPILRLLHRLRLQLGPEPGAAPDRRVPATASARSTAESRLSPSSRR